LRFASLSIPEFDVCYRFEPASNATRLSFDFRLRLPLLMLPLKSRVDQFIKQGGSSVVNNLRSLLE
jgi:hypothetical protein